MFMGWGPNLGENYPGMPANTTIALSNDHPISFEWPSGDPGLSDPATIDSRLRLFGVSGMRIECATCHTVHDPANVPFLAMPNDNSNMCRSCHIK
jgi:predicted CXXCH cytochrome family protein